MVANVLTVFSRPRSYCNSTDDAYNSNNAFPRNSIYLVCSVALQLWSSLLASVEWFNSFPTNVKVFQN